jgi:hypothetical protein
MIFRMLSGFKTNRKNFCELLDTERANRHSEALKQPMRIFSISCLDLQQNTLIG